VWVKQIVGMVALGTAIWHVQAFPQCGAMVACGGEGRRCCVQRSMSAGSASAEGRYAESARASRFEACHVSCLRMTMSPCDSPAAPAREWCVPARGAMAEVMLIGDY